VHDVAASERVVVGIGVLQAAWRAGWASGRLTVY
jgi:hypothetical protein